MWSVLAHLYPAKRNPHGYSNYANYFDSTNLYGSAIDDGLKIDEVKILEELSFFLLV